MARRKRSTASPIRDADELIDEATQRLAAIERALEALQRAEAALVYARAVGAEGTAGADRLRPAPRPAQTSANELIANPGRSARSKHHRFSPSAGA